MFTFDFLQKDRLIIKMISIEAKRDVVTEKIVQQNLWPSALSPRARRRICRRNCHALWNLPMIQYWRAWPLNGTSQRGETRSLIITDLNAHKSCASEDDKVHSVHFLNYHTNSENYSTFNEAEIYAPLNGMTNDSYV